MKKQIVFEGKVTIASQLVDFRIYNNTGADIVPHYSFEINPEVRDASQVDFYRGAIQRAEKLKDLLFQFHNYQGMFSTIVEMRFNTNF